MEKEGAECFFLEKMKEKGKGRGRKGGKEGGREGGKIEFVLSVMQSTISILGNCDELFLCQ